MKTQASGAVNCGFTLVELLVVMGIITILAGLIISAITGIDRTEIPCMNNLRQIGLAAIQYKSNYGMYPWTENPEPAAAFQLLVDEGLLDEPRLFVCPACTQREADYNSGDFILSPGNVSYAYSAQPVGEGAPSRTIIIADAHWYGEDQQGHRDYILVYRKSGAVEKLKLKAGDTWEEVTEGKLNR